MVLLFLLIFSFLCVSSTQSITMPHETVGFAGESFVVKGYVTKNVARDIEEFVHLHKKVHLDKFLKGYGIDNYTIKGNTLFIGENFILQDISVKNNVVFLDSTVKRVSGLRLGMKIGDIKLNKVKANIEKFYKDNGYVDAKVDKILLKNQKVIIYITEGKLYIVDAVNVENMDIKLRNMSLLKSAGINSAGLNIVPRIFNKETISYYEKQLRYALNKKGYFDSNIVYYYKDSPYWHPFIDVRRPFASIFSILPKYHKGIILTFKVDYGPLYKLNINGIKDEKLKEKVLKSALKNIKTIDAYNMRNLEYNIKKILSDNIYTQPSVNISVDNTTIDININYKKIYGTLLYDIKYKKHPVNSFLDEFSKSTNQPIFDKAYIEEFKEFIKSKLVEEGFFKPNIEYFKVVEEENSVKFQAYIDEGPIYKIRNVYVNNLLQSKDIGLVANKKNIKNQEETVKAILAKKYAFSYFKYKQAKNIEKENKVDIYFESNIKKLKVNEVFVYNDLIYRKSVKRYLGENKQITNVQIKEIRDMIRRQPHIRSYRITPIIYNDNTTDLVIKPDETKKNQFFGSITYDSVDDLGLTVGFRRKNFLNSKHILELSAGKTFREEYFNASIMGFDVIEKKINDVVAYNYKDRDEDDYKYNLSRFNFALNRFGDMFYLGASVFVENIDIYETEYDIETKKLFLDEYYDLGFKFSIKYFAVDNKLSPKNGAILSLDATPVNFFKKRDFYKYEAGLSLYKTIFEKFLFASVNEVGTIRGKNKSIPLNYRYTLGGPSRMKAFDYRDIGSEDSHGNVYGGKNYYYSILFLGYNVIPLLYIGPFYEVGDAFEHFNDAKTYEDVGLMLDLKTSMGSFIASYAHNPENTGKSKNAFYISFSTTF